MDIDAIVEQVIREVLCCMGQLEQQEKQTEILVLSETGSRRCHELLEKFADKGIACLDHIQGDYLLDTVHTVILMDITRDNLYKLANGACETKYLRLASEAILTGKKVIIVKEEVEIFKYENSAPILYFNRMLEHLDFLRKCGVIIAPEKDVGLYLQGKEEVVSKIETSDTYHIAKKLITDRDVKEALRSGAKRIEVMPKTIITQLAKDSMSTYHIELVEKN